MEVHMSQRLAVRIGAFYPGTPRHVRSLKALMDERYILVRDEYGEALFWPLQDLTVSSCE